MHGTLDSDIKLAKTHSVTAEGGLLGVERGTLLAGLIIDSVGAAMVPSRTLTTSSAANARYYVSMAVAPGANAPDRIPATRLDSSVVATLRRVRLLTPSWQRENLVAILRRVLVLEDAIILQLDKRLCLAAWRAEEPMLQRITTGDVVRLVATCLAKNEELTEAGTALCLRVPRHSRARKIRGPRRALLFQQASSTP